MMVKIFERLVSGFCFLLGLGIAWGFAVMIGACWHDGQILNTWTATRDGLLTVCALIAVSYCCGIGIVRFRASFQRRRE